jgi:5-methylcytosine-specific restriction endonuclease McrA
MLTTPEKCGVGWPLRAYLRSGDELDRMALARVCPSCGLLLTSNSPARCKSCITPQRAGSSRPELDHFAWQKLRRAARLRDGDRCVRCGSIQRLSVHHVVPGSDLLEDLLTLCSRCHAREHSRKPSADEAVFLETKSVTPTRQGVQRRWPHLRTDRTGQGNRGLRHDLARADRRSGSTRRAHDREQLRQGIGRRSGQPDARARLRRQGDRLPGGLWRLGTPVAT